MAEQSVKKIDPTILVIFGATGELSRQRLIPALWHLAEHDLLPKVFSVVGFARSKFTEAEFRKLIRPEDARGSWDKFSRDIHYLPGNFTVSTDFAKLAQFLHRLEGKKHNCANRLFYFATLPSHYETISHQLDKSGLLVGCAAHQRETRVVVEKPFGRDLRSAQKLDHTLAKYFSESQIYRIDHYLGKETVQNLLTARFANTIFEPVWNANHIDHVQISALEETGIGSRGAFYEQAGALRDFVQNHLIQLLALISMEPPADLSADSIRDERVKVLKSIRQPSPRELKGSLVTGQYQGYRKEPNVSPYSMVETYAALKIFIENSRFAGVPFYLRTGKQLGQKTTEISVHFKRPPLLLFQDQEIQPNVLLFKIQPNEGLFLNIVAKYPGFGIRLHPVTMELGYHTAFAGEIPEAYERLLLDFMEGDQRLFARSDEIEYSWKYIDAVEQYLLKAKHKPALYRPGTLGPRQADEFMQKDQRQWHIMQ